MRVKFSREIPGDVLAEALMEVASSFEESHEVTQITEDRLEPGSVKKVLDTLSLSIAWHEHRLTRGLFAFLLGREPHEVETGYGYSLHYSEIRTDKEYDDLYITGEVLSPWSGYSGYYPQRSRDREESDKLLNKFAGLLFKNLGLIEEAPQGA